MKKAGLDAKRAGEVFRNDDWFRWPTPDGEWSIRLRWGLIDHRVECIGVELWRGAQPDPTEAVLGEAGVALDLNNHGIRWQAHRGSRGPQAITSLRELPLGVIVQQRRAHLLLRTENTTKAIADDAEAFPARADEYAAESRDGLGRSVAGKRGRRPLPASDYLKVAGVYLKALNEGKPPLQAVMKEFWVAERGAGRRIKKAEELGFLAPTSPGRPHGPGPLFSAERLDAILRGGARDE